MRRLAALLGVLALGLPVAATPGPAAASSLAWHGIVEGAYGHPWTAAERMRVLRWMADHGFNAYVHAPKDDLYQRSNWRKPYPSGVQAEFNREARFARAHGIEWVPNLSPAVPLIPTAPDGVPSRDLCFSCPADLGAVVGKLRPFLRAGSHTVMISFDDVAKVMTHPRDLATYGVGDAGFGRANGDFLSRLRARLAGVDPQIRVLTVGATYSGTADSAYLRGLRSTLAPGIGVMWTGTGIPSQHWTPSDARAYGRWIGRTPLVWDNWTNDDTSGNATPFGTARIFLGPYTRAPAAATAVDGFFFNPMNEADLNLLPLATAGEWMADPAGYRPVASWHRAIAELALGASPEAERRRDSFRAWAETSWSNKLDAREAPTFVRLSAAFVRAYRLGGRWPDALGALDSELALVRRAPTRVAQLPNGAIAREGAAFLENARLSARSGALAGRLLAAERPALRVRATSTGFAGRATPPRPGAAVALSLATATAAAAARASDEFTYGWRTPLAFEIPPYAVPGNVMDDFVDRALAMSAAWMPSSAQAASGVTVTLDGRRVAIDDDGRFRLPATACGGRLVATDGAGGRTVLAVPAC